MFKIPDIPKYDGTSDPREHITTYTTTVKGNDLAQHEIKSVLLKKFGETLMKGALTWYSRLPEDSFEILTDSIIKDHAGARNVQARKSEYIKNFAKRIQTIARFRDPVSERKDVITSGSGRGSRGIYKGPQSTEF
uniref:Uncharacterized protein LOC104221218 n=1 Tax=Nicotiana sylvestris TaxID=4096 RepID=A0A1U7W8F5_NICSY|nr:PREDICTED: uncharacterized protein LOC104221218 [Nicotiana sylvestris]